MVLTPIAMMDVIFAIFMSTSPEAEQHSQRDHAAGRNDVAKTCMIIGLRSMNQPHQPDSLRDCLFPELGRQTIDEGFWCGTQDRRKILGRLVAESP